MTLNFPGDTSQPYIDPISGLKYLFNSSIGAWETAIQPPAVISSSVPALTMPGFLWWDSDGGSLYIYYKDADSEQWVECVPSSSTTSTAIVSSIAPTEPSMGDIWVDTSDISAPKMYVRGTIGGTIQWILTNRSNSPFAGAYGGPDIVSGATEPNNPQKNDLWFDTANTTLKIYNNGWTSINNPTQAAPTTLTASGALSILNDTLSIKQASTIDTGVSRFATQGEVNAGNRTDLCVSPGKLKQGIREHLPAAETTSSGVISLATGAEVVEGTNNTKAVTPQALKNSISSLGVALPAGMIIEFAGVTPPSGYLACNGANVKRADYPALYSAIGTTYGIGDGNTTFALPLKSGDYLCCIKH